MGEFPERIPKLRMRRIETRPLCKAEKTFLTKTIFSKTQRARVRYGGKVDSDRHQPESDFSHAALAFVVELKTSAPFIPVLR